jgi:Flp pilus assembly protein TadG
MRSPIIRLRQRTESIGRSMPDRSATIGALLLNNESGSSLVEFSLTFGLLLLCAFGIIWCSVAFYVEHFVTNAAKEATRYAMVRGSSWSGGSCSSYSSFSCSASSEDVSSFVDSIVPPGIDATQLTVTTTWPGTDPLGNTCDTANGANSPSCVVDVQVSYPFSLSLPFLSANTIVLSSSSSEVIAE